jgi:predicted metalloendopeptidase
MPRIKTLECGAAIYIYADDHDPPHFHLVGPDTDANVYIETFDVYEGEATRRALKEAKEWWSEPGSRQILRDKWRQLNERE